MSTMTLEVPSAAKRPPTFLLHPLRAPARFIVRRRVSVAVHVMPPSLLLRLDSVPLGALRSATVKRPPMIQPPPLASVAASAASGR